MGGVSENSMICRKEYPKPQFQRNDWMNLNGQWFFEIDHGNSGIARGLYEETAAFSKMINVPFCPESSLSGIGYTDFMNSVWYKRSVTLTKEQLEGRTVLHFGAVDYFATVYVNGVECGTHQGGYVSFCFDITQFVREGENVITVNARDDSRDSLIPSGKQSFKYASECCHYTRTTGIWQTVWLEFTPKNYIKNVKYYPDIEGGTVTIHADLVGEGTFTANAFFEGEAVGAAACHCRGGQTVMTIKLEEVHLWEVGKGNLYDLTLQYGEDTVSSYFGLRSIQYTDYKFLLNGKSVFQRLVLDQGFYPDGIYTAPSDEALAADIDRGMAMGFNGARLHEKIFEERFLYHCDKKGYLVWGEYPDWGLDLSRPDAIYRMIPEWIEAINRDFNHPSIVGWCPLNEVWDRDHKAPLKELVSTVYQVTKSTDPTRPCIDASGGFHVQTDIYDLHDYQQDPEIFRSYFENFEKDFSVTTPGAFYDRQTYDKKVPFFISEYGGMAWDNSGNGWGYGDAPKTAEEFIDRLQKLTDVLMDNKKMFGFCYTQLYDIEQEQNGLYTYVREPKFPPEKISPIFSRTAAIEDTV